MSIETMRQALEALDAYSWEQVNAARAALRTAIAEAEKQEPVAWLSDDGNVLFGPGPKGKYTRPLYTTPPAAQRQWVGLTDEEIEAVWKVAIVKDNGKHAQLDNQPFVHFARAIEAKLKEKNNG